MTKEELVFILCKEYVCDFKDPRNEELHYHCPITGRPDLGYEVGTMMVARQDGSYLWNAFSSDINLILQAYQKSVCDRKPFETKIDGQKVIMYLK